MIKVVIDTNVVVSAALPETLRGPVMTTVTISLPESLKAFIDHQLATKGYGNVSEYFRSLLREAQQARKTPGWRPCCSKAWPGATTSR